MGEEGADVCEKPTSRPLRARDPGLRLSQLVHVTWVHCPDCDGAAKLSPDGARCIRCGYITIPSVKPQTARWARIDLSDPRCTHCRDPLPGAAMPTARHVGKKLLVRVKCPQCAKTVNYPGKWSFPANFSPSSETRDLPMFLKVQVGGHILWVHNLAHLDALYAYLGARLRERGWATGLTMMARLPDWMKSASNRPKIMRAMRLLRERATTAGIDE